MSNRILSIGSKFPAFNKLAVVSLEEGKEFEKIDAPQFENDDNQWTVLFWWPKDFTFVCPTEIAELIRALPGVTTVTMAGSTGENTETYKIKLISQKPGIEAFQALKKNALTKYTPIKIVEIGKNTIERK